MMLNPAPPPWVPMVGPMVLGTGGEGKKEQWSVLRVFFIGGEWEIAARPHFGRMVTIFRANPDRTLAPTMELPYEEAMVWPASPATREAAMESERKVREKEDRRIKRERRAPLYENASEATRLGIGLRLMSSESPMTHESAFDRFR